MEYLVIFACVLTYVWLNHKDNQRIKHQYREYLKNKRTK